MGRIFFSVIPAGLILMLPLMAAAQLSWPDAPADPKERGEQGEREAPTKSPSDVFGGLGEVSTSLSQLQDEQERALRYIDELARTDSLRRRLQIARDQQAKILRRGSEFGDVTDWSVYQVDELRGSLAEQKDLLGRILEGSSGRIQELELQLSIWKGKQEYWRMWEEALQEQRFSVPEKAFARARTVIGEVLEEQRLAIDRLVDLQNEVTAMSEQIRELAELSSGALQRGTFRKTAPSFFDPDFYRQIDTYLWQRVRRGIAAVEGVGPRFLREQGWLFLVQILAALTISLAVLRFRHRNEVTDEWDFILRHPWHTGIFISFASLSMLYVHPPAVWRFGLSAAVAVSTSVLVGAMLEHRLKAFLVFLLAAIFLLSLALQMIGFPQPLYRIYLALISLAGAPLLHCAAGKLKAEKGGSEVFVFMLRAGAVILLFSLIAQIGGYNVLSFRLIESSIKTVFIVLVAAMVVKLGRGGIDFLLSRESLRRWRYFRRFGKELDRRFSRALVVLVAIYVGFYLLEIWGIYDSIGRAFQEILAFGFTAGEIDVTVEMVVLALLALYAASAASWAVSSILEAEVFPRRQFDRGIRDAIKKILNYSIIIVGVIFALTITGVELRNFTVLAGAFGIGIGFGMQNIVNNFVSGLILLFERPVKVGDLLVVDEDWGTVRKIGLRSTVITTLDESEIILPNSILISEKVTNWSLSSRLCRITVPVGVAYGSDVPLVLRILQEVAGQVDGVLADPAPSPLFSGFGDSSLDFELRVWISEVRERLRVRSEVCKYVDRRFREEGVQIPFPQRDLHLRSVDDKVAGKVSSTASEKRVGGKTKKERGSMRQHDAESRRFTGDDQHGPEGTDDGNGE